MDHEAGGAATAAELDELIERLRPSDGECPFCGRDPFHRVDNGVGYEAVAVECCEMGIALFQHHDEQLVKDVQLRAEAADALAALRRERDEARDKAETNACKANRLEEANAQMAAALREIKHIAFNAEGHDATMALVYTTACAALPASPSPEQEPFGADVGRERLDAVKHEDRIERLDRVFYIRWTSGPDYEDAFICVEDGEPDMNDVARVPFGRATLFKAGYLVSTKLLRDAVIEECAKIADEFVDLPISSCPSDNARAIAENLRALAAKGGDHDR